MKIDIITIFPDFFDSIFRRGIIRQALKREVLEIATIDLRDFANDRHKTVDDRPYGGGEGMVLKPEPVFKAVEHIRRDSEPYVILLSAHGRRFDQRVAKSLSLKPHLTLICGRYEGVDQRVADNLADEELSIGDFVLSGGELAAAIILDAVARLIPDAVGNAGSVLAESFMEDMLDHPHYTRPAEYQGLKVPEVLLSGNHFEMDQWKRQEALKRTLLLRPDLMKSCQSDEEVDRRRCNRQRREEEVGP